MMNAKQMLLVNAMVALVLVAAAPGRSQDRSTQLEKRYQEGVFLLTVEGDVEKACEVFEKLITETNVSEDFAYRVHVRLVESLKKLGRTEEAAEIAAVFARRFPGRARPVVGEASAPAQTPLEGRASGLIELLGDRDENVRGKALEDLVWIGEPAVPYIAQAIRGDNFYRTLFAARALFMIQGEAACAVLRSVAEGEDDLLRRNVYRALQTPHALTGLSGRVLDEIRTRLTDRDPQIQRTALDTLSNNRDDHLLKNALTVLRSGGGDFRTMLIWHCITYAELLPVEGRAALVQTALEDTDARVREGAVRLAIKALEPSEACKVLEAAAKDPEANVRKEAADGAYTLARAVSFELRRPAIELLSWLASDSSERVRRACLDILRGGKFKTDDAGLRKEVASRMVPVFNDRDPDLRARVIGVLDAFPHPSAQDTVLAAIADSAYAVRAPALSHIREHWGNEYRSPMPAILDADPILRQPAPEPRYRDLRHALSDVIGRFARREDMPALVEMLPHYQGRLDTGVLAAIERIHGKDPKEFPVEVFAGAWENFTGSASRVKLFQMMEKTASPALLPLLVEIVKQDETGIRTGRIDPYALIASLAENGSAEAIDRLVGLSLDAKLPLAKRREAIKSLSGLEAANVRFLSTCKTILGQEDQGDTKEVVLTALIQKGDEEGIRLVNMYFRENGGYRSYILWKSEGTPLIDASNLEIALADPSSSTRRLAVKHLHQLNDPAWVPSIEKMTGDEYWEARYAAASALAQLGGPSSVPHLLNLLRDPEEAVRIAAKSALEAIRFYNEEREWWAGWEERSEADRRVLELLDDPDMELRVRAIRSLGTMRVAAALPRLLELMKDKNPKVREAAAEAIDRINAGGADKPRKKDG